MTDTFIRDMSDYDTNESLAGFSGLTHKFTEGTNYKHADGPRRLNAARNQGLQILGGYHVLRTPGNGGNGSISAQADYFFSYMDATIPWWRHQPFLLQIDAEKWPYDAVTGADPVPMAEAMRTLSVADWLEIRAQRASTTIDFANLLLSENTGARVITYASRGQYGDALTGIPTDLWNAAYRSSSYPGDGAADWAPYSGKVPVLWQWTSTPFDKNAYRGAPGDLLAYLAGGGGDMAITDVVPATGNRTVGTVLSDLWNEEMVNHSGYVPTDVSPRQQILNRLDRNVAAVLAAIGQPVQITLDDATRQAIVAGVVSAVSAGVELAPDALAHIEQAVHTELGKVQITVGA